MKYILLLLILFLKFSSLSSQNLSEHEIRTLVDDYKQKFTTSSWKYNKPLIIFVIDCSNSDSLYFSVSSLKQGWQFDFARVGYYYNMQDEYILISSDSSCKEDYYIPVTSGDSLFLRSKLIPDTISLSTVSHTIIYLKYRDEEPSILEVFEDTNVKRKYLYLLPYFP